MVMDNECNGSMLGTCCNDSLVLMSVAVLRAFCLLSTRSIGARSPRPGFRVCAQTAGALLHRSPRPAIKSLCAVLRGQGQVAACAGRNSKACGKDGQKTLHMNGIQGYVANNKSCRPSNYLLAYLTRMANGTDCGTKYRTHCHQKYIH
jgi:hypothetical protein